MSTISGSLEGPSSGTHGMGTMVDVTSWMDMALKAFEPASKSKGLPFGSYLHSSPPRRQRSLTGPLDPSQESFWHKIQVFSTVEPEQQFYLQEQCAFFTKLPLDVRMIIYEIVLGGMVFHITTNQPNKTRLLSHICKQPHQIDHSNYQACFALSERRPSSAPRDDYMQATGLLPLLVSCRRIYSEAIETLYSANTFDFWENRVAFTFLKVMVPPQRLSRIRRFRWDMRIPHHPDINSRSRRDWSDLFTFFTNETCNLQHLYLKLETNHPMDAKIQQTADDDARGWIEPIVLMAYQQQGCKVQIVTHGIVHEPGNIFKTVVNNNADETFDKVLGLTCTELHRRIRLSISKPG